MAVTCCGKDRATPFCPQCGRKLMSGPLVELLDYLTKSLGTHKRRLESALSVEAIDPKRAQHSKDPARLKVVVAKWQRWVDAVSTLVQKEET